MTTTNAAAIIARKILPADPAVDHCTIPSAVSAKLARLASEQVYEFVYIAATNKIKGSTAGFTMRPLAVY